MTENSNRPRTKYGYNDIQMYPQNSLNPKCIDQNSENLPNLPQSNNPQWSFTSQNNYNRQPTTTNSLGTNNTYPYNYGGYKKKQDELRIKLKGFVK